jgi:hypothetical protein
LFEDWETLFRFGNGLFTVLLAVFLFHIYRKKGRNFYLLWSLGYLAYGLNIFFRIFVASPGLYPVVFIMSGFMLILTGIGSLINRTRMMLFVSALIPLALLPVMFLPNAAAYVWFISVFPYFLTALSLVILRLMGVAEIDLLIIGWWILLMTNIALAFGWMTPVFVEVMAIFGKTIIYYGMVKPKFSLLAEDLKRFLIAGEPTAYMDGEKRDRFVLLSVPSNHKKKDVDWIAERVEANASKGVRTVIISVYDTLTMSDLQARGVKDDNIYIVRIITGGLTSVRIFAEHVLSINDDMSLLELLFTDIIAHSNEKKIKCEIIIYSLSYLIHTHGAKRVYSFLISKLPVINTGDVSMICIYYPDTHEKAADRSIFESLADRVASI